MGLSVRSVPSAFGYDLVVNEQVRVTLRVAFPSQRHHRVTVGGRKYHYRYRTWHFNFHHHGRMSPRYTDFFICVAVVPKRPALEEVFVIPWESVTGKTFSLHGGRRRYTGRYAPFSRNWELLAHSAKRVAPLRRVA